MFFVFVIFSIILYDFVFLHASKRTHLIDKNSNEYSLVSDDREYLLCFFTYLIGVLSILFIGNLDRFLIKILESENFSEYFLLVTYIFVPLTIISSTFGISWASKQRANGTTYDAYAVWLYCH